MQRFVPELIEPVTGRIFLEGPAGAGKTSAAVGRMLNLLEAGVPGDALLVLAPQRTLAWPYLQALRQPQAPAGTITPVLTVGGLAQRMVDLFWPLAAGPAGFANPDTPPVFLTLETAQYYMAYLVRPLIEQEGLFDSVTIDRNRLYSQLLDDLNKAAVVGFPHTQIGERLRSAWVGDPAQLRVYQDVQRCVSDFRSFCLQYNLLDFSLQMEVFRDHLWPQSACRDYLLTTYRHIIFDNLEEDTPLAHDLLRDWLPALESALLIYDWDAGYRSFLGADPQSGYALKELCDLQLELAQSWVLTPATARLAEGLARALDPAPDQPAGADTPSAPDSDPLAAVVFEPQRYFPEMIDWVVESISGLVHDQGLPPGEIVVLAPYLSDALRFALAERLERRGVPAHSHRPSRSLREEPASQCLLTLAELAFPEWGIAPQRVDVAYALLQAIDGLDLVRANLLAEAAYAVHGGRPELAPFEDLPALTQERVSYRLGQRYERLRTWLGGAGSRPDEPAVELDHFLSRLFGEVLSQPGYGFHASYDAGRTAATLVESVQKFRRVAAPALEAEGWPVGREYLAMVRDGVIAAQYLGGWQAPDTDSVLLAPAYTFLLANRPATVQFWLDVGSRGWAERLNQPLTHPFVLSRGWEPGRAWTDIDEALAGRQAAVRLVAGLLRRCRQAVYLGLTELNEQGYEQRGPLLLAFQRLLRERQESP